LEKLPISQRSFFSFSSSSSTIIPSSSPPTLRLRTSFRYVLGTSVNTEHDHSRRQPRDYRYQDTESGNYIRGNQDGPNDVFPIRSLSLDSKRMCGLTSYSRSTKLNQPVGTSLLPQVFFLSPSFARSPVWCSACLPERKPLSSFHGYDACAIFLLDRTPHLALSQPARAGGGGAKTYETVSNPPTQSRVA
jgi:hypothetical protein